ncbi:MAG: hypothetical protein AAF611_00110 [Bacteroidota bacterium]
MGDPTPTPTTSPNMEQVQEAVTFINNAVLKPEAEIMTGTAKPMIDQATGMMVQDLQSFLKSFEQIGLIALTKLTNNILTYGTYFHNDKKAGGGNPPEDPNNPNAKDSHKEFHLDDLNIFKKHEDAPDPSETFKSLFTLVSDYGKQKADICNYFYNVPNSDTPKNNSVT